MTLLVGMDTDAGRGCSDALAGGAQEIADLAVRLEQALHSFDWDGRDAEETRSGWAHAERPRLEQAASHLTGLSARIRAEADQQDRASGDGASAGWTQTWTPTWTPAPERPAAEPPRRLDSIWRAVRRTGRALTDLDAKLTDVLTGRKDWSAMAVLASALHLVGNAGGVVANAVTGEDEHWFAETRGAIGTPVPVPAVDGAVQPALTTPTSISTILQGVQDGYVIGERSGFEQGSVRITRVEQDGRSAYIVAIPGTERWGPDTDGMVRDLTANLRLAMETPNAAAATVRQAMEAAGIPPTAPVLLAGHSQGGLIAAQLASDPQFLSRFQVTEVLTAGAPVETYAIDPRVRVLSVEGRHDLIPRLDLGGIRTLQGGLEQSNVTHLTTPANGGWLQVMGNHGVGTYIRNTADAPGALGEQLRAWENDPRMAPFLIRGGHGTATAVDVPVHQGERGD